MTNSKGEWMIDNKDGRCKQLSDKDFKAAIIRKFREIGLWN